MFTLCMLAIKSSVEWGLGRLLLQESGAAGVWLLFGCDLSAYLSSYRDLWSMYWPDSRARLALLSSTTLPLRFTQMMFSSLPIMTFPSSSTNSISSPFILKFLRFLFSSACTWIANNSRLIHVSFFFLTKMKQNECYHFSFFSGNIIFDVFSLKWYILFKSAL